MKKNISYKGKLMSTYLILITIPVLFFGVILYKDFRSILKRQESTSLITKLKQESLTTNLKLNDIENIGYYLSVHTNFTTFLREGPNTSHATFIQNFNTKILPLLTWIKNTNNDIQDIHIFTNNENINEVAMFHHIKNYEEESWFQRVLDNVSLGNPYWEPSHLSRNYVNVDNYQNHVFSLWYIVNAHDPINTAYVEIEINARQLFASSLYTYMPISKDNQLIIMDSKGNIFSDNSQDQLVKDMVLSVQPNNVQDKDKEYLDYSNKGIPYYIYFEKIERLDTFLLSVIPQNRIGHLLKKPMNTYLFMVLSTYGLLMLLAIKLSSVLTKKITIIRKGMKKVQGQDFDVRINVTGHDELDQLAKDFNVMAYKIKELINKVYKYEIAKKQSELKALQNQIRPHFIYNTLESLRMLAEINDVDEVSDGLMSLAKLMKQNIGRNTHLITLEKELEFLNHYVKVQNITHNDNIYFKSNIPKDLMDYCLLTFTLQPVVENAVIHGYTGTSLNICIYGKLIKDKLLIIIQNDGQPIEKNVLAELNKKLMSFDPSQNQSMSHIGLINVHKRLKLYYGDEYGLKIISNHHGGTTVIVQLPNYSS